VPKLSCRAESEKLLVRTRKNVRMNISYGRFDTGIEVGPFNILCPEEEGPGVA
jgi:hypothetical protein